MIFAFAGLLNNSLSSTSFQLWHDRIKH